MPDTHFSATHYTPALVSFLTHSKSQVPSVHTSCVSFVSCFPLLFLTLWKDGSLGDLKYTAVLTGLDYFLAIQQVLSELASQVSSLPLYSARHCALQFLSRLVR